MITVIRRHCPDCGQARPFDKHTIGPGWHALLAILTLGLWLPVWLLIAIANLFVPFRCRECGRGVL